MSTLLYTIRLAFRRLIRRKMVSAVIVFCLALGIGANTAIFSVVNALLVRPLPVEDVDRVVFTLDMRTEMIPLKRLSSTPMHSERRAVCLAISAWELSGLFLRGRRGRSVFPGAAISSDFLTTLRIKPILGRVFLPEDDKAGAAPVALLSHSLWQSRFASDPNILGRSLDGQGNYTVVGVLPPGFDLPLGTQIWVSLPLNMETLPIKEQAPASIFSRSAAQAGRVHRRC